MQQWKEIKVDKNWSQRRKRQKPNGAGKGQCAQVELEAVTADNSNYFVILLLLQHWRWKTVFCSLQHSPQSRRLTVPTASKLTCYTFMSLKQKEVTSFTVFKPIHLKFQAGFE